MLQPTVQRTVKRRMHNSVRFFVLIAPAGLHGFFRVEHVVCDEHIPVPRTSEAFDKIGYSSLQPSREGSLSDLKGCNFALTNSPTIHPSRVERYLQCSEEDLEASIPEIPM